MIKHLKWLSVTATIGMLLLLLGGALVTKTGSADGCGNSWPLCEGEIIPSVITFELVVELSHRLVTAAVGILVTLLAVLAWKKIGHVREVKFLSFISVFFLVIQALIGAGAVLWGQSDFFLAAHFGISLISFASVFLLMLLIFEIDKKFDAKSLFIHRKHRIEIYALSIYTLMVVYTGALVRHTEANLVCGDWPFCTNNSPLAFADYSFEQWIQMGHRLAAGILFIWTISLFIKIMKNYRSSRIMFWGFIITASLIISQVFFGAMIIFTMLNLGVALLHALVISCFFGMMSYFVLLSSRSAKYEKEILQTEKQKNVNTKNEAAGTFASIE
ncbi:heme A synthase [Virgibacillus indicus]|uniref:Heme A synthase n=1 Tax=Virgibacillus indicus TaxID=2024554 RepID=A0A265NF36_9BACI|nr:heme A synthase [Virgibacillus indicus]OZU90441.1 heme A synthase [Virgibacillus indicus]